MLKYVKQYEKNCGKNLHKFKLIPDVSTQFKHPNILPDPFKNKINETLFSEFKQQQKNTNFYFHFTFQRVSIYRKSVKKKMENVWKTFMIFLKI